MEQLPEILPIDPEWLDADPFDADLFDPLQMEWNYSNDLRAIEPVQANASHTNHHNEGGTTDEDEIEHELQMEIDEMFSGPIYAELAIDRSNETSEDRLLIDSMPQISNDETSGYESDGDTKPTLDEAQNMDQAEQLSRTHHDVTFFNHFLAD